METTKRVDYHADAEKLLEGMGVTFDILRIGTTCPRWCNGEHKHGKQYRVRFGHRTDRPWARAGRKASELVLDYFWNSYNDANKGITPRAYDVLATIQKYPVGTFADFMGDFGYKNDAQGKSTYRAVQDEYRRVSAFFTPEELALVAEVN